MITKITYLGDGNFQFGDQDIPIDEETVTGLAQAFSHQGPEDTKAFIEKMKFDGFGTLETLASKGVIVDMYEVDYPQPEDAGKETEALASHLNEKRDFVSQQLFPGSEVKDIAVGLRQNLLQGETPGQIYQKRYQQTGETPPAGFESKASANKLFIRHVMEGDIPEITSIIDMDIAKTDSAEVIDYIKQQTDWSKSVVATADEGNQEVLVGFYLLGETPVTSVLDEETTAKEDLSSYDQKKGIQGVCLYVKPGYREQGVASQLKTAGTVFGHDYIWGYQSKHLNNLEPWLKRRRLVAEDSESYVTLQDIHSAKGSMPGKPIQERWIRLLGRTPTNVALEVQGTRYEYSAGENDIREFFRRLRFNQGRALSFLKKKAFIPATKDTWRQTLGQYGFENIEAPSPGVKMIVPGTRAWERAAKVIATSVPQDASREDIEAEAGKFMHTFYVDFGDNFDQLVTMVSDLLAMVANRNERPRPRP